MDIRIYAFSPLNIWRNYFLVIQFVVRVSFSHPSCCHVLLLHSRHRTILLRQCFMPIEIIEWEKQIFNVRSMKRYIFIRLFWNVIYLLQSMFDSTIRGIPRLANAIYTYTSVINRTNICYQNLYAWMYGRYST